MTRICNKIGALPVALYGRWHASPENRWTQIGRAKGREKKIEARKDKRMFEKKRKETRKESKKERCTSKKGRRAEGGKKGGKRKRKGKKTTEGNREAVVAEFCSRTTVVGGAVHIRGKLYPGYCSLAVSVLR